MGEERERKMLVFPSGSIAVVELAEEEPAWSGLGRGVLLPDGIRWTRVRASRT